MMALLLAGLLLFPAGGILSLAAGSRYGLATWLGATSAVLGSALGAAAAATALLAAAPSSLSFAWLPGLAGFDLRLDRLAGFFLLPIFLLSLLCAVYAVGYLRPGRQGQTVGSHWFFYNLLIGAMALVVTAANGLLFLVAWEIMSLSSFFLVIWEHHKEEVRQAAWQYLLATHLGTGCLFAFFLLLDHVTGSLHFGTAPAALPSATSIPLLMLALVGFGTKAGLFPLHVWLPNAHPAAPSHISALMSGVMIKTGIYGFLRAFTLLGPQPAWWGAVLMGLGSAGALFGIGMAAQQHDLKRALAYSTIENVGIIFLALGLALFAAGRGLAEAAFLAMLGCLLHIWNHAFFKGLLFLGAGSILFATGSRSLEYLGGLLRRMPLTGLLLLGGCLAASALPPLNGFVGEWFLYLGLLGAGKASSGGSGVFLLLLTGALALTGGLALLVYTRLAGIALLGEPRRPTAAVAREVPPAMLLPMMLLLGISLGIGLAPELFIRLSVLPAGILFPNLVPVSAPVGVVGVISRWVLLLGAGLAALLFLLNRSRRRAPLAATPTWGCGYGAVTSRMTYSAGGFAELVQKTVLPAALGPDLEGRPPTALFPGSCQLQSVLPDPVCSSVFRPFFRRIVFRMGNFRWLQGGRLNEYLLYILVTLGLLLAFSFFG